MKFMEHEKGLHVNVNHIKFFKIEKKYQGFSIVYSSFLSVLLSFITKQSFVEKAPSSLHKRRSISVIFSSILSKRLWIFSKRASNLLNFVFIYIIIKNINNAFNTNQSFIIYFSVSTCV